MLLLQLLLLLLLTRYCCRRCVGLLHCFGEVRIPKTYVIISNVLQHLRNLGFSKVPEKREVLLSAAVDHDVILL